MLMVDALVQEFKDKGISVDNYNKVVETPLDVRKYKYSKFYRRKYKKPLAKL